MVPPRITMSGAEAMALHPDLLLLPASWIVPRCCQPGGDEAQQCAMARQGGKSRLLAIVQRLVHVAESVTIGFDPLHKVRRQFGLGRRAVKCPLFRIGEIGKAGPSAHIEADCRLLRINVKIVFLHRDVSSSVAS